VKGVRLGGQRASTCMSLFWVEFSVVQQDDKSSGDEGGETKLGLGVATAGVGAEVFSTSIISESVSIELMIDK